MSFNEWFKSVYHCDPTSYEEGEHKAYEAGRKVERDSMRCHLCKWFRQDDELDEAGDCLSDKQMEQSIVSMHFGCIHHEPKEKSL